MSRRSIVALVAFLGSVVPGIASAGPVVRVGVGIPTLEVGIRTPAVQVALVAPPPPVVVVAPSVQVRPARPSMSHVWVDGYWSADPYGNQVWVPGYWLHRAPAVRVVGPAHVVHTHHVRVR